jgi:uncharacterized membrane protein
MLSESGLVCLSTSSVVNWSAVKPWPTTIPVLPIVDQCRRLGALDQAE